MWLESLKHVWDSRPKCKNWTTFLEVIFRYRQHFSLPLKYWNLKDRKTMKRRIRRNLNSAWQHHSWWLREILHANGLDAGFYVHSKTLFLALICFFSAAAAMLKIAFLLHFFICEFARNVKLNRPHGGRFGKVEQSMPMMFLWARLEFYFLTSIAIKSFIR